MYESCRSAHHEREDVDMREDVNKFVMEPLYDAWLCGTQVPHYATMSKERFYKLLGDRGTLPERLARGVGRDLMFAVAYALNHVEWVKEKGEVSAHAPES